MRAKPGKILSPKMIRVLHSPLTLTVNERKRNRYIMKNAIRSAVGDMAAILESGDRKATAFLIGELDGMLARRYGHGDGTAAEQRDGLRISILFERLLECGSCSKAGKIRSVPNMGGAINSQLGFTGEQGRHCWYTVARNVLPDKFQTVRIPRGKYWHRHDQDKRDMRRLSVMTALPRLRMRQPRRFP